MQNKGKSGSRLQREIKSMVAKGYFDKIYLLYRVLHKVIAYKCATQGMLRKALKPIP